MKRIMIVMLISLLFGDLFAQKGTPIPTTSREALQFIFKDDLQQFPETIAIDNRYKIQQEIAVVGIYGILGSMFGFMAGDFINQLMWQKSVDNITTIPAHYALNPTTGIIDLVPASILTISQLQDTSPNGAMTNGWVRAGNAAIGAILSIGIYEFGHHVFRWL